MKALVFDSLEKARINAKRCWVSIVKNTISKNIETVRDVEGDIYENLSGYSDDFIANLEICGRRKGKVEFDQNLTLLYSSIDKAHEEEKWYFRKPQDKYMSGLTDYVVMDLPESWIPPVKIEHRNKNGS